MFDCIRSFWGVVLKVSGVNISSPRFLVGPCPALRGGSKGGLLCAVWPGAEDRGQSDPAAVAGARLAVRVLHCPSAFRAVRKLFRAPAQAVKRTPNILFFGVLLGHLGRRVFVHLDVARLLPMAMTGYVGLDR